MPLLSDQDRQFLEEHLEENLRSPVKICLFTQTIACQFCRETEQVLNELVRSLGQDRASDPQFCHR